MERIRMSKYIQIVKRARDYAVYHSLFGNLCLIDQGGIDFLKSFQVPRTITETIRSLAHYDPSEIRTYLRELKARYFLVPDGCDEYEIIDNDIAERKHHLKSGYLVRALQLVVSNVCNFRCTYCIIDDAYNSRERSEFQHSASNQQMSFEVARTSVEKLMELLRENGNDYLNIEFFGGEPLMNWSVIESILETFKNGEDDVGILYSITTNGSLITERMAEIFKKYNVTVVISFDSPENTERICADGKNSIELVKRSLDILKRNEACVTFNSVISRETIEAFDGRSLVDFAVKYGVRMIGLILDLDLDFYRNDAHKEQVLDILWDTYSYAETRGMPVVGYWHQIFSQILGRQAINFYSGYKTCPATGCKLSVEPAGHVFICKCCSGYLGHISQIQEVLSSDMYEEYAMRAYRNAPACEGCEIEGFCSGVCMGSLEKKYGSLHRVEDSSCDIFRRITRKLIQNLDRSEADLLYMPRLPEVRT